MKFIDILGINKEKIISIVGAGGKTTLLFTLANEVRNSKVLVTTTTKIYVPAQKDYDYIFIGSLDGLDYRYPCNTGINVLGSEVNFENKIVGISDKELSKIYSKYDYCFIEADGSKRKKLKGWNHNEPVVSDFTEITIGVLDVKSLAMKVEEENIHRLEKFIELTGAIKGEFVNSDHLISLIFNSNGLFKNSIGRRILFINKVETDQDVEAVNNLLEKIKRENLKSHLIDSVIYGSLKNSNYELIQFT